MATCIKVLVLTELSSSQPLHSPFLLCSLALTLRASPSARSSTRCRLLSFLSHSVELSKHFLCRSILCVSSFVEMFAKTILVAFLSLSLAVSAVPAPAQNNQETCVRLERPNLFDVFRSLTRSTLVRDCQDCDRDGSSLRCDRQRSCGRRESWRYVRHEHSNCTD